MTQQQAQKRVAAQHEDLADKLNWLRAGVLGANDGIVSTAGLVLGVVGATDNHTAILVAGVAGLVSGALSMAAGEYVSVSTQRDTERAAVKHEAAELHQKPSAELTELTDILEAKGLNRGIAFEAARELTRQNALAAHAEMELGIRLGSYTNPWQAAIASAISFSLGALVPLLSVLLATAQNALWVTVFAVAIALSITGYTSAKLGHAPTRPATWRNVAGGLLAMLVTYGIGRLIGSQFLG